METIARGRASSGYATQHAPPSTIRLPPPRQEQPSPSHDGGNPYYALPDPPGPPHGPRLQADNHHRYKSPPAVDTNEDPHHDPKRPRACESCRGLKVRCETNASEPEGACRRCAKAGRQCVITFPSRKRQKKTDSRVAELEKRIDALTANLQASKRGDGGGGTSPEVEGPQLKDTNEGAPPTPSDHAKQSGVIGTGECPRQSERAYKSLPMSYPKSTTSSPVLVGQKRRRSDDAEATGQAQTEASRKSRNDNATAYSSDIHPFLTPKASFRGRLPIASVASSSSHNEFADVIDREILKASAAAEFFDHYNRSMAPHFPAVVFSPGSTAAEIRRTKPILFLAILSVSAGVTHPELQRTLSKELMRMYADNLIVKGKKSLEIVQALQVTVIWYSPPQHYEDSIFYQLIHIAAVMALDLGLGKRTKQSRPRFPGLWQDHPWRKTPLPDPLSVECRRAWLGCYFLCVNTSMALRRPNLLRWSPYSQECIEALETSPNASDKVLCQWVKLQHITEEIGIQFSMDDPAAQVGVLDTKLQYTLRGFERQLEEWSKQVPPDLDSPSLKLSEHVVNLYMHEVAMHTDECTENVKSTETPIVLLTPAHISALTVCLTSIHGLFDTFLSFATDTIRNLPVFHFVRVAHASVMLIKMYFAATAPNAELGRVISKEDLKVEHYLDRLPDAFKAAAENEMSRAAQKFLVVLVMLRSWFQKQNGRKSDGSKDLVQVRAEHDSEANLWPHPNPGDEGRKERTAPRLDHQPTQPNKAVSGQPLSTFSPHRNTPTQPLHTASTPLHLLSEVAMVDSAATSTSCGQMSTTTGHDWYSYTNNPVTRPPASGLPYTDLSQSGDGATDNALDGVGSKFDWNASMVNEELEQAMSMTFGEWDLGSVLQADEFLFDLIDGGPSVFEGSG